MRVDGLSLRMKDAELDTGGMERESVVADGRVVGYTEKPVPAKVKGTIVHGADSDLIALNNATDVTIVFSTDTGVDYTVRGGYSVKPCTLKSGGDADAEFEGQPAF